MASGDITEIFDERRGEQLFRVADYKLSIVVAINTSEKTETALVDGQLGFVGFSVPAINTTAKTATLSLTDSDGYEIYNSGAKDASAPAKYSEHLECYTCDRPGAMNFKVVCDENVDEAEQFEVKWRVT